MRSTTCACYLSAAIILLLGVLPFPLLGQGQAPDPMRQRVTELEKENQQLRKTVDLQTQELLELRNKVKDLESALPEHTTDDSESLLVGSHEWSYAAGLTAIRVMGGSDSFLQSPALGNVAGNMIGYEFSAGKDMDRLGLTVFRGKYDIDGLLVAYGPDTWAESSETYDRTDVELAWSRIVVRSDRFGIGFVWGGRYVRSDRTETVIEVSGNMRDEQTFDSVNNWMLGSLGMFMSTRFLREWPLSFFASGSVSLGAVNGKVRDAPVDDWTDGVIDLSYHSDSMAAWAFTGTLGLQYPVTEHCVARFVSRAQWLNSSDGYLPFFGGGTFYDMQAGGSIGVSILF